MGSDKRQRVFSTSEVLYLHHQMERRFSQSVRVASTGCLLWTGPDNGEGYGYINVGGTRYLIHRFQWMLTHHVDPRDDEVCHTCDNRRCFEPTHLFRGTHADNMADMKAKGRAGRRPRARLTDDEVREYRRRYASGESATAMARDLGIPVKTLRDAIQRRTYREVSEAP